MSPPIPRPGFELGPKPNRFKPDFLKLGCFELVCFELGCLKLRHEGEHVLGIFGPANQQVGQIGVGLIVADRRPVNP